MTDAETSRASLLRALDPMLTALLDPSGEPRSLDTAAAVEDTTAMLTRQWPIDGPEVTAIAEQLRRGIAEGWLCERGEPDARFGRLAKPTPNSRGFSIDVVCLRGAALAHRHPAGEITLALPLGRADLDARFDGHRPGWIVLGAQTQHVPTVTGGTMVLLYALPRGEVAWG